VQAALRLLGGRRRHRIEWFLETQRVAVIVVGIELPGFLACASG